MSSSAAASAYWRVAGMSYLKYSNLCASMLRDSLKEPLKAAAKSRERVYFKNVTMKDGAIDKQVMVDIEQLGTTAESIRAVPG